LGGLIAVTAWGRARAQLLGDLAEGAPHRPFGVEQLLFDQRARARHQRRVHRHHFLRVEDQALLALAQALADHGQLVRREANREPQPLQLLGDPVGLDVIARHAGTPPVDEEDVPERNPRSCWCSNDAGHRRQNVAQGKRASGFGLWTLGKALSLFAAARS